MSVEHPEPGQMIDLNVFGGEKTTALVKQKGEFEVIRLVLAEGKSLPPHKVEARLIVQCLSGSCVFSVDGEPKELQAASWLHLEHGTMHAVDAKEQTVLLLTIVF